MIRPYLSDMINDHKTRRKWKIQLTMQISFISSKNSEETRTMCTKSHNIKIMIGNEKDEIIEKLFESLLQNYQKDLEESMRESVFVRDSIKLLYYHLQKIGLKRGGSYIDSPKWLKNNKATINPKNNDNCYQYALTVALNHQNIGKNPQRISKNKPFIDQYNWKEIDFPSEKKDWKKLEQNNKKVTLNILFVPHITKQIRHAYKSKHVKRENQVILLMITDGKKWYYLAVKSLSAFLRGITSNHKEDFQCLNCFHSCSTKSKLKKYERVCNDHDYCYLEMSNKDNKRLKYNH